MIVIESSGGFRLIEQHEHAIISGFLAEAWRDDLFIGKNRRHEVELAIKNHDACWQRLDKNPILNAKKGRPVSFIDFPLEEKIDAYRSGVDEMLEQNDYAAFLISLHYTSFFRGKLDDENGQRFKDQEQTRQKQLRQKLDVNGEDVQFHFDLLQLCDNLSLYLCMNEWGSSKEEEYPWFREGFPQKLATVDAKFYTKWINENEVALDPYPFKEDSVKVTIPNKHIRKVEIDNHKRKFCRSL
ncbi:MAG: DUF3891 family protein [Bacillus sp. (in: Bacteria)]|nr:DUF3891 family protein [Bacillus sp. (in: firmicutes)]